MATTKKIAVTVCDNELIVLAFHATSGSYELFRVLSGNTQSVKVTATLNAGTYVGPIDLNGINNAIDTVIPLTIPAGTYNLALVGLNWGGPQQFTVNVDGTPYELPYSQVGGLGVVWSPAPISITV